MTDRPAYSHPLRPADLAARKPTRFSETPDTGQCADIAAELGIEAVRKLTFKGELRPAGRRDWTLEADLGATIVQACIVTLAPVTTRIEETVVRTYLSELPEPVGDEVEMPEDDTIEPLPAIIDIGAVMIEALALALPLYPRAPGAELGETAVTEPGKPVMTDEDARPFAGLADFFKKSGDTGQE
jgi:uncharacterized metal-binding protein YceD (DUF177 family)